MVSMLTSGVVDHGSGKTKNYKIGFDCLLAIKSRKFKE